MASSSQPEIVLDWTGRDDPDNPRNFSRTVRIFSTVAVTSLAFVTAFAASVYSPGSAMVAAEFDVSQELALLPLSLYNIGLAAGSLLGSPLSETFGRKVVLLITTPTFMVFTLGAGFSRTITTLSICRFFGGVFAAPAVGNASATITDYTAGRYRAVSRAFYYSVPTLGASIGPLVGGFVVKAGGWRWTQWVTVICAAACYVPILFIRETYKRTILQRRPKRLGLTSIDDDRMTVGQTIRYYTTTLFLRPLHMLVKEPIVSLVCLYNGFMFGLLYTFVTVSPWIYEHYYGFGSTATSLSFLGLVIGSILAPIPLIAIDHIVYQPKLQAFKEQDVSEERFSPEHRLYPAMLASFGLPISLFLFAWTTRSSIHWICPIFFQGLTMLCNLTIYAPTNLYMIDTYGPLYAAFPLFSLRMYQALGIGWATSILGFCALAIAPVPFWFYRNGRKLRTRTKYEIAD